MISATQVVNNAFDEANGRRYNGFRLLSDQVLVRPLTDSEKMSADSRMFIPGNADRGRLPYRLGIVVALGAGDAVVPFSSLSLAPGGDRRWKKPASPSGRTEFSVSVGDKVLFAARSWGEVTIKGEKLIVLHEDQHILAVVDNAAVLFSDDVSTKKK